MIFRLNKRQQKFFENCVGELLASPKVREMGKYIQHGDTTTLTHCIYVAYISYALCCRLGLRFDERSLIRGALLHDFFLYDWHKKEGRKLLHAFRHPGIAEGNADALFSLNDRERDIIKKHMWPLTVLPPKYRESFFVGCADKISAFLEFINVEVCPQPADEGITKRGLVLHSFAGAAQRGIK